MKRILLILTSFAVIIACNKELSSSDFQEPQEIVINIDGTQIEADVTTKTTAVSSMPSKLYFAGTTGSSTSQTSKWTSVEKTVSSNKISTGYYQTATATAYNYYLSNCAMTFSASGHTITADGTSLDVIAGVAKSNTSTAPSVTLDHVFARTGTLSATCSGYTLSNLSYKLKTNGTNTGTKGTYNIYTGAWSSTTTLSEQTITNSSDLYLIPGSYTLTISGTRSKGDFSKSFTGSVPVTLVGGKINNISATITGGDQATEIIISTSLTAWGTTTLNPSISL